MLDQHQTPLLSALYRCSNRPHAGFYVPGHRQGRGTPPPLLQALGAQGLHLDLPELPELDDLFAPSGVIQAAQALAAAAFGADQTWFLTNGSTCGVVAAILATCGPGDRIILPRNVHSSVITGLILSGAQPVFVEPAYDSDFDLHHCLTPAALEQALTQPSEIKAVLAVSPTYEGICGDLAALAALAHRYGIPLLVDEAHGGHLGFHTALPRPALAQGADLVVQSTHKTVGAITQAAMLHRRGTRVDAVRVDRALRLLQSTSPNYLLLASLDAARHQMVHQGAQILDHLWGITQATRAQLAAIPKLPLLEPLAVADSDAMALDVTRLTVSVKHLKHNGFEIDEQLHHDWGITAELPTLGHLTFVPSLGTTSAELAHLVLALGQLAHAVGSSTPDDLPLSWSPMGITSPSLSPRLAYFAPQISVPWDQAMGHISAELICPYPPGIPILVPGEVITAATLTYLRQVEQAGGHITGCADPHHLTLQVVQQ